MIKIINWIIWLVLVILWNYRFPQTTPFQDVLFTVFFVYFVYNYSLLQSRYLKKVKQEQNSINNEARLLWVFTTIINQHEAIKL